MAKTATLGDIDNRITEIDELVFRGNTGQISMTMEQRAQLEAEAGELMRILAQGLHESGVGSYQALYDDRQKLRALTAMSATTARYMELHPEPQPEIDAVVAAACNDYFDKTPEERKQADEMLAAVFGTIFVELPSEATPSPPIRKGLPARRWGWGLAEIVIGLVCWIIGDGHSIGVNPPIPENAKLGITLIGWPYIIDGVRVLRGHGSFMRRFHVYLLYAVGGVVALGLAAWLILTTYDVLTVKAMIALGLAVAVLLLYFILRELKRIRNR